MIRSNTERKSRSGHVFWILARLIILVIGDVGAALAQTNSPPEWAAPTTVLSMASGGAWGAATNDLVGVAISAAIADCRRRSRQENGCGAYQMTVRAGWSLGIRCGERNILVAEKTLLEAEQAAIDREVDLRRQYGSELLPCVRLVSIDPSGTIIAPYAKRLVGMLMREKGTSSP